MLLSLSIFATALLVIAARFASRDRGSVSRPVVWTAALLPPLGLALTMFFGRSADRERIDVQFVGSSIPMSFVQQCGTPGRNVADGRGVWIGGGRRWADDGRPDAISLPGYRSHLAEICSDPKSDALLLRQVREGESWFQLPSQKWGLRKTNDIDTQHLVIRGGRASGPPASGVPPDAIIDFVQRQRKAAVRAAPTRGFRESLLRRFRRWTKDRDVACVDISGGLPARCASDLTSTKAPLFAWPSEDGWDVLPPGPANLTLQLPQLARRSDLSAWKAAATTVTVRMVTRRTVGGVADQTVPIATSEFEPLPLRLGTRYEIGFAQLGSDLIVLHEDPSVQLRMSDLYGGTPLQVKEGEFDLTFGAPSGEELLVVDLSSRADHLAPKTIFESVRARVTLPLEGDEISVIAQGRPAQKRRFNEVFALDASGGDGIRPLLLIRRVNAPAMTLVLPLLAALLLIVATFLDDSAAALLDARWLLAPLLLAMLDLRLAMSTRWLLNEYSSAEALRNWIVNGAYVLIAAPVLMLVAVLLRGSRASMRASTSRKDLYDLSESVAAGFSPPKGVAAGFSPPKADRLKPVAPLAARFTERDVVPLLQWLIIAAACTLVWILLAGGDGVLTELLPTMAIAAFAAALAWGVYRLCARWTERERGSHDPFGFAKQVRGSLAIRAAVIGMAFLAFRFLTYFNGSQEQLLGIRVDVFSLPLAAVILAVFTRPGEARRGAWGRFLALGVLFLILFGGVGAVMNDFGLVWIGGMAFVLALPIAIGDRVYATVASLMLFFILFLSPTLAPSPFREVMRLTFGNRQEVRGAIRFTDGLVVSRERDYYRLIDANQPKAVTEIPSQLAREVVIERERVRYQSLDGAWREPFRSVRSARSPWTGAGFLRGRAVIGDSAFMRAARSDYVFPTHLRAEFGSLGLLAALACYVAIFLHAAAGSLDRTRALPVALWSAAIAAGTGIFMLGGTTGIFPFSGKWPLLLSFASNSDAALGLALLMLALVERD